MISRGQSFLVAELINSFGMLLWSQVNQTVLAYSLVGEGLVSEWTSWKTKSKSINHVLFLACVNIGDVRGEFEGGIAWKVTARSTMESTFEML